MKNIKIKTRSNGIEVIYKIKKKESVNFEEFNRAISVYGIAKPTKVEKQKIEYFIPATESIINLLSRSSDKYIFFRIVLQVLDTIYALLQLNIAISKLNLDINQIFVGIEIFVIFEPAAEVTRSNDECIKKFIFDICSSCHFAFNDKTISSFASFISNMKTFDFAEILNFIEKCCPNFINSVPNLNFKFGNIEQRQNDMYKNTNSNSNYATMPLDGTQPGMMNNGTVSQSANFENPSQAPFVNPGFAEDMTMPLDGTQPGMMNNGTVNQSANFENPSQAPLVDPGFAEDMTMPLDSSEPEMMNNGTVIQPVNLENPSQIPASNFGIAEDMTMPLDDEKFSVPYKKPEQNNNLNNQFQCNPNFNYDNYQISQSTKQNQQNQNYSINGYNPSNMNNSLSENKKNINNNQCNFANSGEMKNEYQNFNEVFGGQQKNEDSNKYNSGNTVLLNKPQFVKRAYLNFVLSGAKIELNKTEFCVGSDQQSCDYAVHNNNVSKVHLTFIFQNGEYFIRDNGSTNGTSLNGNKLMQKQLYKIENYDRIIMANEIIDFQIVEE